MGSRELPATGFQSGQKTNDKEAGYKVKEYNNVSKKRNVNQPDPLKQVLVKPPPQIPTDNHLWSHSKTPRPTGARYSPAGEFGRPKMGSLSKSKATGMSSHDNKPGQNALGKAMNEVGSKVGYPHFTPRGGGGGKGA